MMAGVTAGIPVEKSSAFKKKWFLVTYGKYLFFDYMY